MNDIVSAEDWVQTLMAAAGEPDIQDKLIAGMSIGDKTYKVHLDGYDQRDTAGRQVLMTSGTSSFTGLTTAT